MEIEDCTVAKNRPEGSNFYGIIEVDILVKEFHYGYIRAKG